MFLIYVHAKEKNVMLLLHLHNAYEVENTRTCTTLSTIFFENKLRITFFAEVPLPSFD